MDNFETGIHLDLKVGRSENIPIHWEDDDGNPINLSGYTSGRMQLRPTLNSDTPILDLSTENGSIIIDGYNGGVDIFIPSNIADDFIPDTNGVWDLFLYGGTGIALCDLQGTYYIDGRVTR